MFTSCQDDYDDTALWNTVNDLEQRLAALEEWQNEVNHNIQSLYELINTTDYITSVTPYLEGGKEVGYTITFLHSDPIVIYHGEKGDKGEDGQAGQDGQDGYTPQIGLTQEADGNWYWTLDGELMLDPQGNPIRANGLDGQDGEDGQDGKPGADGKPGQDGKPGADGEDGEDGEDGAPAPVPQISLGSTLTGGTYYGLDGKKQTTPDSTAWYLSVDNGTTWYRISGEKGNTGSTGATGPTGPTGPKGDSLFESVTDKGDYVEFILANGTSFTVQKYNGSLTFSLNGTALTDLTKAIDLADGALTYTPATAEVSARILDGEGWSANAENGTITIKGVIGSEALLEVTLMDNGRVIETYRLIIEQTGLQGEGTAATPYLVSSPAELIYVAEQVNNNSGSYYYYKKVIQLTQDIDLEGTELTIGIYKDDEKKYFYGTLDGNGHSIKGLKINGGSQEYVGLFPYLTKYATVKNLTLENPIVEGEESVAALAGGSNGCTIENCHVKGGKITSTGQIAGGIVAYLFSGNISNCSVEGTTIEAVSNGGGIVGFVPSTRSNPVSITACYFNGTLTSDEFAGGIVGALFNNSTYDVTVQACYASGSISGYMKSDSENNANSYIATGGIVGKLQFNCKVSACYSTANLSGKGTNGGIIGLLSTDQGSDPTVSDCYWSISSASVPTYGIGAKGGNSAKDGGNDEGAAKVDATTTWSTAMNAMNAALSGTGWQYEEGEGETFPLVVVSLQGN